MRRIFEFKVFDILQDKENVKFLDKVKKENPLLYTKFINLVGNKGLEIAKERYKIYEPEYVKNKIEEDKIKTAYIKKIGRDKFKKEEDERILKEYENEIDEIENLMFNSELYHIDLYINSDQNISNYLNDVGIKSKYVDFFNKLKKTPKNLNRLLHGYTQIDSIYFAEKNLLKIQPIKDYLIKISQSYDIENKKFKYDIYFSSNMHDQDYLIPIIYRNKETEFIEYRSTYIWKLSKYHINKDELYNIINNYSKAFTDDFYNEWSIIHDSDKYNL